jgi:hypothetical protein
MLPFPASMARAPARPLGSEARTFQLLVAGEYCRIVPAGLEWRVRAWRAALGTCFAWPALSECLAVTSSAGPRLAPGNGA